jgi:hypothetical protein
MKMLSQVGQNKAIMVVSSRLVSQMRLAGHEKQMLSFPGMFPPRGRNGRCSYLILVTHPPSSFYSEHPSNGAPEQGCAHAHQDAACNDSPYRAAEYCDQGRSFGRASDHRAQYFCCSYIAAKIGSSTASSAEQHSSCTGSTDGARSARQGSYSQVEFHPCLLLNSLSVATRKYLIGLNGYGTSAGWSW